MGFFSLGKSLIVPKNPIGDLLNSQNAFPKPITLLKAKGHHLNGRELFRKSHTCRKKAVRLCTIIEKTLSSPTWLKGKSEVP